MSWEGSTATVWVLNPDSLMDHRHCHLAVNHKYIWSHGHFFECRGHNFMSFSKVIFGFSFMPQFQIKYIILKYGILTELWSHIFINEISSYNVYKFRFPLFWIFSVKASCTFGKFKVRRKCGLNWLVALLPCK